LRSGDQARARGGANQSEVSQLEWMNAGAGTLANDQVDAKILHRWIENFLDSGLQAMDFVEKENFLAFERSQDCRQIAFSLQERPSAGLNGDIQFIGDNLGESGLAETGRAVEQDVIESFAARARGFDGDGYIFLDALLTDVFFKPLGADACFDAGIFIKGLTGDDSLLGSLRHHAFCGSVRHFPRRILENVRFFKLLKLERLGRASRNPAFGSGQRLQCRSKEFFEI
jgi:hypothetical protein